MDKNNWIFLTQQEALDAIAIDFQQYGHQPHVFKKLVPLILSSRYAGMHPKKRTAGPCKGEQDFLLKKSDEKESGLYFSRILRAMPIPLKIMARICAIVFQTRTRAETSAGRYGEGLWVENQMNGFVCSQCGHCCSSLGYENECTKEDYFKWQTLGRLDVLERVLVIQKKDNEPQYRIWLDPESGVLSLTCPWLKSNSTPTGFICLIQEIKPDVCRQYPFTRKHAGMTGCKGEFSLSLQGKIPF